MRSEISKQSTCRDWGWATGLPHSYLLLSEGETGFASWTRTHSAPLLCQTPAPSTVLLSLHLTTIGFEKPSSFYKHNCSSQVLSSQLSPGTERDKRQVKMGYVKLLLMLTVDKASPHQHGVETVPHGCSRCCAHLAGLTLIPSGAHWGGYS